MEGKVPGIRATYLFLLAVGGHVWVGVNNALITPVLLDEYAHIPTGISLWQTGQFTIYREDPPLISSLAALPPWLSAH